MNFVTQLKKDTVLDNTHEIKIVMLCRETWSGTWPVAPELRLGKVRVSHVAVKKLSRKEIL